jgi:hypothetical protein
MFRHKGDQMFCDANWPDAGTAAAVRDAEGLVQIQVTNVRAQIARTAKPHLRIHVGTVHVNLAAVLMHDRADFLHCFLKHAVC